MFKQAADQLAVLGLSDFYQSGQSSGSIFTACVKLTFSDIYIVYPLGISKSHVSLWLTEVCFTKPQSIHRCLYYNLKGVTATVYYIYKLSFSSDTSSMMIC